jgi:hypothetical protein
MIKEAVRSIMKGKTAVGSRRRPAGVEVDDEQRRRLIECCASFAAACFRPARPGGFRARDRREAAARIDAIIRKHGPA